MSSRVVLDTSAVLEEGIDLLKRLESGTEVIFPLIVIRELEAKRTVAGLGYTARKFLTIIDDLGEQGDLHEGVSYGHLTIRVELNHVNLDDLPQLMHHDTNADTRILAVAKHLDATLITKDRPLRILAKLVGVPALRDTVRTQVDDVDSIPVLHVDDAELDEIFEFGWVRLEKELPINASTILKSHDGTRSALAVQGKAWNYRLVESRRALNMEGRSAEQHFAIDHLYNEDIPVVNLTGKAGSGKTALAIAAGIDQVLDSKTTYNKIVIFRSVQVVGGEELGFLPGEVDEKFGPYTAAVNDVLQGLPEAKVERIKKEKKIEVSPISFIRGRTISGAYIILDEAQNVSKDTILTVMSRLGKGSKLVMTSDLAQRDNRFVGKYDGIFEVVQRLFGEKLFAHVALRKSERSAVAEMAGRLLED